ncbi:MAG: hypothetical protein PHG82_05075 [Candidatus Gracilibacteria bacterium]|nr:hypothetical protein [Candidatus Gracilibacteria bacterium]
MAEFYPGSKPMFMETIGLQNISGTLTETEEKLLRRIDRGQTKEVIKAVPNFYKNALSDCKNHIGNNKKLEDIFYARLVEKLKLEDIEDFYRNGIIPITNLQITKLVFSRFLFETNIARVLNLLSFVKSIGLFIYPDLEISLNGANHRKDLKTVLIQNFKTLLSKADLKFNEIEIIDFPKTLNLESLESIISEVSNISHEIITNPEKVDNSELIAKLDDIIIKKGKGKGIKNPKTPKIENNTKSSEIQNIEEEQGIEIIESTKKEKLDLNISEDIDFAEIINTQSEIFFDLLDKFRFSKRSNNKILPEKLYISFVEKSSEEDFFKLLDIEALTINKHYLSLNILEAIFLRLMTFDIDFGTGINLKRRIDGIKGKILAKTKSSSLNKDLESQYNNFIERHTAARKKSQEGYKIKDRKYFEIVDDTNLEYTADIDFFSRLLEFKKSRRFNLEILPESLYISFVTKSSEEDFLKLLGLEAQTIHQNNLSVNILKSIFLRLTSLKIEIGKGINLITRVKRIRSKIFFRTELEKNDKNTLDNPCLNHLEPKLELEFDNFIKRYNETKKGTKIANDSNKSSTVTNSTGRIYHKNGGNYRVAEAISYHSNDLEKIKFETNIKTFFPNFLKFRTKADSKILFDLIDRENSNKLFLEAFFDFIKEQDEDIISDLFLEDDNFFSKSFEYQDFFVNHFKNIGKIDLLVERLLSTKSLVCLYILDLLDDYDGYLLSEFKEYKSNFSDLEEELDSRDIESLDELEIIEDDIESLDPYFANNPLEDIEGLDDLEIIEDEPNERIIDLTENIIQSVENTILNNEDEVDNALKELTTKYIRDILAILAKNKAILSEEYIAAHLSKMPKTEELKDFILNY